MSIIIGVSEIASHLIKGVVKEVTAIGRQIVSFDRSDQVFGNNTTNERLKGRDEIITKNTIAIVVSIALAAFIVLNCYCGHHGLQLSGMSYFYIGLIAFAVLIRVKEIAIQSLARAKERKAAGFPEETKDTQYTLQEWADEIQESFRRGLDVHKAVMHRLTDPQDPLILHSNSSSRSIVE